ncbi:MAG: hypothetical protein ABIG45_04510, partial [Bacillota bacterium]
VGQWLRHLKPSSPPQHPWMEHGSFDFCLENAMLKAVQLGLHGGLPQLKDAAGYTLAKMKTAAGLSQKRRDFSAILTSNLLSLAQIEDETVRGVMLAGLDEMHRFAMRNTVDIYLNAEERKALTGVPRCWKDKPMIKPALVRDYGFAYPLIYDIVGMHSLCRLRDVAVDQKIGDIIRYISTDAFHRAIGDGYGILPEGGGVYHAMGWDPKYPGWLGVAEYLETTRAPRLLFFALHASRYPAARETKWYRELLHCLVAYQTAEGRFLFPAQWLPEKQGYAVTGSHLSFGENRRKKSWREIESTFMMRLFMRSPDQR